MVQLDPAPLYDQTLAEKVVNYLQTRDARLFPFAEGFDDAQKRAFINDLRAGLSDITESGSKRGTSASGFITSDQRLHDVVAEWAAAHGAWPAGSNADDDDTALYSLRPAGE